MKYVSGYAVLCEQGRSWRFSRRSQAGKKQQYDYLPKSLILVSEKISGSATKIYIPYWLIEKYNSDLEQWSNFSPCDNKEEPLVVEM